MGVVNWWLSRLMGVVNWSLSLSDHFESRQSGESVDLLPTCHQFISLTPLPLGRDRFKWLT